MKRRSTMRRVAIGFVATLAWGYCLTAWGQQFTSSTSEQPEAAQAIKAVAAGTDYLTTAKITYSILGKAVVLTGKPVNPKVYGKTDTLVERTQDAWSRCFVVSVSFL